MNILIVDDEPMVRQSMARVVRSMEENYCVREAEDGEEAIDVLKANSFDLVIADIRMPVVDGLQLTEYVRKHHPDTEIILLTGYAEFEFALRALRQGVSDYLLKPVAKEIIMETVRKSEQKKLARDSDARVQKLRAENVLEKRVQDLLHGVELPHYDQELLPSFHMIHLFSITTEQMAEWERTVRFAIQNIVKESLFSWGTPVVMIGNDRVTVVWFISDHQRRDETIRQTIVQLEQMYHIRLQLGDGGCTNDLSDLGLMYIRSLNALNVWEREPVGSSAAVHPLIRSSLLKMQAGFASDLTLKMIADELYVNPNYLSSLFKKETGLTFSQHLIRIRIDEAKQLLRQTTLKIYEICERIGYADQAHFSRVFKSLEGLSPNEYRVKYS